MYLFIFSCFRSNNDHFSPPPIFCIADQQSTYYVLAGFSILFLLINVLVIILKAFWIEIILLWRDIARPHKTRNGKWQVSSFLQKSSIMAVGCLSNNLLIVMLPNTDSLLLASILAINRFESTQRTLSILPCHSSWF